MLRVLGYLLVALCGLPASAQVIQPDWFGKPGQTNVWTPIRIPGQPADTPPDKVKYYQPGPTSYFNIYIDPKLDQIKDGDGIPYSQGIKEIGYAIGRVSSGAFYRTDFAHARWAFIYATPQQICQLSLQYKQYPTGQCSVYFATYPGAKVIYICNIRKWTPDPNDSFDGVTPVSHINAFRIPLHAWWYAMTGEPEQGYPSDGYTTWNKASPDASNPNMSAPVVFPATNAEVQKYGVAGLSLRNANYFAKWLGSQPWLWRVDSPVIRGEGEPQYEKGLDLAEPAHGVYFRDENFYRVGLLHYQRTRIPCQYWFRSRASIPYFSCN